MPKLASPSMSFRRLNQRDENYPLPRTFRENLRGINDSLDSLSFSVSTPDSKIVCAGTLAASSKLHLSVSTSNLEEWWPLVKALGGPTDLPFRVYGDATFREPPAEHFPHQDRWNARRGGL